MTSFEPQDHNFEAKVRESFGRQVVMDTIGATLVRVAPGEVDIELPFRDDLTQQHGFVHAGIVATILDSACGYAAFTLMPAEAAVLSIEYKINMLAPSKGDRIVARAHVVRAGRTVTVCSGDAFDISSEGERHVATMQASMMTILERRGLRG